MTIPFSQTGGLRMGRSRLSALNASWPFASLQVQESELALSCFGKHWSFPKASVLRLSKHRGVFSTGLRIEHDLEGCEAFLVFWTFRFDRLRDELEQRGFQVS